MQTNRSIILIAIVVLILTASLFISLSGRSGSNSQLVACTQEAMQCPDGSFVGRTGPMCEFAACPPLATSTSSVIKGDVTVGMGKTGTVGDLSITVNKVLQDSRCPIDVQCIQAGAVTINVTVTVSGVSETENMSSAEAPLIFRGQSISIVSVSPVRMSKVRIPVSAYVVSFHVEKAK